MPSSFSHPVTEKLTKSNFALWNVQVLRAICGVELMSYIDDTTVVPPEQIDDGRREREGSQPGLHNMTGPRPVGIQLPCRILIL